MIANGVIIKGCVFAENCKAFLFCKDCKLHHVNSLNSLKTTQFHI